MIIICIFLGITNIICIIACIFFIIKNQKLKFEVNVLKEKLDEKDFTILNKDQEIQILNEKHIENINIAARKAAQLEEANKNNIELKNQFKLEFENLANKIFTEKNKEFKSQSSETLLQLINPLGEKIKEFQTLFTTKIEEQNKEQYSLKNEITNIVKTNQEMMNKTENLTKALKGEAKTQGNWGEHILEKLLENTGFIKGEHYDTQTHTLHEGQKFIPDVLISLPEGKKIVIDSKVSLTNYEQYISSEGDLTKQDEAKKNFIKSIKSHLDGLSDKEYYKKNEGINLDFVIMFLPIDGVMFFAMQNDSTLFNYALNKNVFIASPLTIMPILRTIMQMWKVDKRIKQVGDFVEQGAALYDKVFNFVDTFKKIGNSLHSANTAYSEALGQLAEGKGNVLRKIDEFRSKGELSVKKLLKEKVPEINDLKTKFNVQNTLELEESGE